MDPSETIKIEGNATHSEEIASSIDDADITTAHARFLETEDPPSINPSSKPKDADMTTAPATSSETEAFAAINSSKPEDATQMAEIAKDSLGENESNEDMAEADVPAGLSNPSPAPETGRAAKKTRSHAPKAPFDKPDFVRDFPYENAELTDHQLGMLICQGPTVRKKWAHYFNSNGHLRPQYHGQLFAKLPNGELKYPEDILLSNVALDLSSAMQRWQQREEREANRKPAKKKKAKKNKASTEPEETDNVPETAHENDPYRSRSRLGSAGLPRDSLASAPISGRRAPPKRGIDRHRSQSPRRDCAAPASGRLTVEPSGVTYRGEHDNSVSATGADRPMRGNSFGPRDGDENRQTGEDEPWLYDPAQPIQRYRAGDLDPVALADLKISIEGIHREVSKLHMKLLAACDNSNNLQFKMNANDLMIKLWTLQNSCWMLQRQVTTDMMEDE